MKHCDYIFADNKLTINNTGKSWCFDNISSVEGAEIIAPKGRTDEYSEIKAVRTDGSEVTYSCWKDLPVVRIGDDSENGLFLLWGEHWTVRAVKLHAYTDHCDTLTECVVHEPLYTGLHKVIEGDIFIFENVLKEESYLLISETPDHVRGSMTFNRSKPKDPFVVAVKNGGYPVVFGKCNKGEGEALCREYLRHANVCPSLVTMSNTWGDCNSADRVCHAFIEKEIEAAREIGVDIVQIDDGWQAGNTLYKCQRDERGNRIFDEGFWELNTERFPDGIMPLSKLASSYGIKLGMWFAPASRDCFSMIERDKAVMTKAYEEYGARFFKLDMYQALDKPHVDKMLELLAHIHSLGDDVTVQMDVTRYERLNYLCGREYGTIFVENRYTKNGWSFPYKPLKNLWDICRYVPSNRFQFELVNPDLNTEYYEENDPLAPVNYTMDYLFAGVMLSNPLFWMEIQFLSEKRRAELSPILKVWKEHRAALSSADVLPIGERPSGVSNTGFYISKNGKPEYLLLFREYNDHKTFTYDIPFDGVCIPEILATNGKVKIDVDKGVVKATFEEPRSYAFIKLNTDNPVVKTINKIKEKIS